MCVSTCFEIEGFLSLGRCLLCVHNTVAALSSFLTLRNVALKRADALSLCSRASQQEQLDRKPSTRMSVGIDRFFQLMRTWGEQAIICDLESLWTKTIDSQFFANFANFALPAQ